MQTILFQLIGVFIFILVTLWAGKIIRKSSGLESAQKPIRVVHFCFWFFLVLPAWVSFFYPGLSSLDEISGFKSLPIKTFVIAFGVILCLIGTYYSLASTTLLARIGLGAMAFKFSKHVVIEGVYQQVRNPMALGYYLLLLGVGLIYHSTYFFLFNLILVIPSHIFYIKYFEEYEVELRLGKPYILYKSKTPFLIPRLFNRRKLSQN